MDSDKNVAIESLKKSKNLTFSQPNNPYQYNGETVDFQESKTKNTHSTSRKVYIESYGCQMNFSDGEIVASILAKEGFETTSAIEEADILFLNTCSIRDKAEQAIHHRLVHLKGLKKKKKGLLIGILGCMAERLKTQLLDENQLVDLVVGPDAYRDLPKLIAHADQGHKAVNTFLSREETYADISPVRLDSNGITAFISIMRGCDNMCSFCVVPFTRGRERSRDPYSIVKEAKDLFDQGYREITLLGQNVDSYKWHAEENNKMRLHKKGIDEFITFAKLLDMVANIHPDLRIRFSTSHPRDITDEVLHSMAKHENICKHIHLPVQSGNTHVLDRMNRGYTRSWYIEKVNRIRQIVGPDTGISSDIIAGFCGETMEEHQDTLSLMDHIEYDFAYMFCYSERPGTVAAKKMKDDIPDIIKKKRLQEIITKQRMLSLKKNQLSIGKTFKILVEGPSKRSGEQWQGRNSANKVIVFSKHSAKKGKYAHVRITYCTGATLLGKVVS